MEWPLLRLYRCPRSNGYRHMPSCTTGGSTRPCGDRDPRDDDEVEPVAEESRLRTRSEACEGVGDVKMGCLDMAAGMDPNSLGGLVESDAKDDQSRSTAPSHAVSGRYASADEERYKWVMSM